jgi:hypothetical protein
LNRSAEFLEQVGFGAEVAEVVVAGQARFFHRDFHRLAVVAMEGIALDDGGLELLAAEHQVEGLGDRGGAGAG